MQLRELAWNIDVRPGGWIRFSEEGGPRVYLKFELTGPTDRERIDLKTAVVQAGEDEVLSGRTWRRIPMTEIEQALNRTLLMRNAPTDSIGEAVAQSRQVFTERGSGPTPLETLDEYFERTKDITPMYFNPMPSGMLGSDTGKLPRIKAPEGRLTDDFLKDVAEAYLWCTKAGVPPAPSLAELTDVPVRRVHRWVADARKRGFLPPARPGRAG
ncbi:hypothetical protein [Streptomyces albicerus]|uniref:hypothetical protein n=1 Tax=Streptomyces albicerus TaxID=2569859 RepID=UPI00124BA547|nr:hypothetical protein [Streptomyces albicerus]